MLLFQLPVNLPLVQQSSAGTKVEDAASKGDRASKNGAKLELPTGRMGKIMVYKSGKVKMQLGDVLYDVSFIYLATYTGFMIIKTSLMKSRNILYFQMENWLNA